MPIDQNARYVAALAGAAAGLCPVPALPDEPDFTAIYRILSAHSLFPMAGELCENPAIPAAMRDRILHRQMLWTAQYTAQLYQIEQLLDFCREEEIPVMPLKGYWMRPLYPEPEVRFSCDFDFWLPEGGEERVAAYLTGTAGFELSHDMDAHAVYHQGAVCFELHPAPVEQQMRSARDYFLSVPRGTDADGVVCWREEDQYLYMLLHTHKHLQAGGCGLKALCDLELLERRLESGGDRVYFEKGLALLELGRLYADMRRLCGALYRGQPWDDALETWFGYLVEGAAYGTFSHLAENRTAEKGRIRFIFGAVFQPFRVARDLHPSLRRAPFLYPVFLICRPVRLLFSRRHRRKLGIALRADRTKSDR